MKKLVRVFETRSQILTFEVELPDGLSEDEQQDRIEDEFYENDDRVPERWRQVESSVADTQFSADVRLVEYELWD